LAEKAVTAMAATVDNASAAIFFTDFLPRLMEEWNHTMKSFSIERAARRRPRPAEGFSPSG
jgi:hypothetical protein